MLLNKYKYSLNRGLQLNTEVKKKGIKVKSYAVISQATPVLYDISINAERNSFVLYNDHEYLHRECTVVTDSNTEQILNEIRPHYCSSKNNFTVFIANQPVKSDQIIMDFQDSNSLLCQTYQSLRTNQKEGSQIVLSIVGVRSENVLTDQFYKHSPDFYENSEPEYNKPVLRLKNLDNSFNKYELENLTKRLISDESSLHEHLVEYKEMKNQNEYMSLSEDKYWDWLQGQLFIMTERVLNDDNEVILRSHYLLKINQYLQTASSLMLKLGMTLRKLQERTRKGAQNNETKLFKFISNCWINSNNLETVHLFLQIGHHLTIKEEYQCLVSTSEILPPSSDVNKNFEELPFFYIKNYSNYPKITSLISKLNKQSEGKEKKENRSFSKESEAEELRTSARVRAKSYARDTLSSIQKKRINSIQREFEETQEEHNRDLEEIIQEAANLYKESNMQNFRLTCYKKTNRASLQKHKKVIEVLTTIKPAPQFYRSERMKEKLFSRHPIRFRTPKQKQTVMSDQKYESKLIQSNHDSAYEIYTKGKRIRNFRQLSRKQQRTKDFVEALVKRQILELQRDDQIFRFEDESQKEIY